MALAAGWRCLVCGASVDIAQPLAWRCPNAIGDDRHHELQLVQSPTPLHVAGGTNPFIVFREHLAWDSYAATLGMTDAARQAMVADLDDRVSALTGAGFVITPYQRADRLSDVLGFSSTGGIWVKDETRNVAGSHKARHLFSILLHLVATESVGRAPWPDPSHRPPLAIASCGNAALAAATLAASVEWPLEVFVPMDADPMLVDMLHQLSARVTPCARVETDPPGDPCVHRFHEAVALGAVPFSVQGPENAWCLDGGRTIGWEMAQQSALAPIDHVFIQVGGGALAACTAAGLRMGGSVPCLVAVQTEAAAPLHRAWTGSATAGSAWGDSMWPWEHVGTSAADGILDDETYDWLPVVTAMHDSGGSPIVVGEADVLLANDLARLHTSIDVSHTGTAGLAGLLAGRSRVAGSDVGDDQRVAVIFSGVRR
ncbi:MAG: hypothetical protein JWN99_86 [Ilumatobacteraceae bacterium]|nr:hypothetical protein [Ilumatobacteraceae bacterium]